MGQIDMKEMLLLSPVFQDMNEAERERCLRHLDISLNGTPEEIESHRQLDLIMAQYMEPVVFN